MFSSFFNPTKESILQAIFKASIINFLSKFFGYLRQLIIAVLVGFNADTDAFFLAFSLLGLFLIFTETFDTLGIPKLVEYKRKSLLKFRQFSQKLLGFTVISTVIVTILAILFIYIFSFLLIKDTVKSKLVFCYFLLLIPYLILSFLFHSLATIHRSLRHFTVFFFGEFLTSILAFLMFFIGLLLTNTPKILPIALSLARFFSVIYLIKISKPYLGLNFEIDETTRKFLKNYIKLTFVYSVFSISAVLDKVFASFLPTKSISALSYGWMIVMIPKGIFRLENILITKFSEINLDIKKINYYLLRIFLLNTTFAIGLFLFSPIIVDILFSYGKFSSKDQHLTVLAIKFYSLGLPFILLWEIIYRIFQVGERILLLIPISLLAIVLNAFLNYVFIFKQHIGLIGVCIATDIAYLFAVVLAYSLLLKLY